VTAAFSADVAAALSGPDWLRRRRLEAFETFAGESLPDGTEEVWKYSPIADLDLDAFAPVGDTAEGDLTWLPRFDRLLDRIGSRSGLVTVHNGLVVGIDVAPGVTVTSLAAGQAPPDRIGSVMDGGDALVHLNDAFSADGLVVEVEARTRLEHPLVVLHWVGPTGAETTRRTGVFPRTHVRVGEDAELAVVEVLAGPEEDPGSLVVPVTEFDVGDAAMLSHVSLQTLGQRTWHVARLAGRIGVDASLRTFSVGLGGAYDRSRVDVAALGRGASSALRTAYFGSGTQIHDIRTLQDHAAERTTSDLLCKGAVTGSARSVYTGLIRVRRGAVRSDAFQTNHNLVLAESAHADSVPNLDIEENDVRCSHASTVGPVDEDQRYYVESRGIAPERATQLIVEGFFEDIVERCPVPAATGLLGDAVITRVAASLESGGVP
jgi:Fe-S cluster assembly protein SufD